MTRQPIGQQGNPREIGGNLHACVAVFAAMLHPLAQRRTRMLTSRRISSRVGGSMNHRVAVRGGRSAQGLALKEEVRLESGVDTSTRSGCCTGNQANAVCRGSQQANAKANRSVQRDMGDQYLPVSGSAANTP